MNQESQNDCSQGLNEFELISRLTSGLHVNKSVVTGAGDDCAVLDAGLPGKWLLLKTDAVVEGVHFTADTPPEKIGHKALGRALSDVAAMAGTPCWALVTLGLPGSDATERVCRIYDGLNALARCHDVAVVGGETTANHGGLSISVALAGEVEQDKCTLRTGAQVGDGVWVTGELGGSLSGRHLEFEPRLEEARWLAAHFRPTAMIDLSDGLAGDIGHLFTAANAGAELLECALPVSHAAKLGARQSPAVRPPTLAALTDGEDFELLFTLPSGKAVALHDAWKEQFPGTRLSCIGRIAAEPGLRLREKDRTRTLPTRGYIHFK